MVKSDLFLQAVCCQNSARAPVWIMRQAGRYLPDYRALRKKYSFMEMVHNPEIAAEVTLMPIHTFGMDAAILFSDILVVAEAFGVGLHFKEGSGPIIDRPLHNAVQVDQLPAIHPAEKFHFIGEAIKQLVPNLNVPLIGFCGGPFTVASYMIEGGSSRDLLKTKRWMLHDPASFHRLLTRITKCSIDYLEMQIDAGVHAVQIFDSWANYLGYPQFKEYCLSYLKQIVDKLHYRKIPIILFCRGSSVYAKDLASLNPAAVSVDWNADLAQIRSQVPKNVALQGNLDPDVLYAPLNVIKQETTRLLQAMGNDPGYIFNLGHGIKPDMDPEAVMTLVETVKNFSVKS